MGRPQPTAHGWVVALATLFGAALRAIDLAGVPPRWDEGWSIAHAALPLGELLRVTAADVHPPLYYLLLGAWQSPAGLGAFSARYLSLLLSVPAIPLAYVAAAAWGRSRRVGALSVWMMAGLPLAVYYGGVARMYSLAPAFVLLATYGAVSATASRASTSRAARLRTFVCVAVGGLGAMLTLYHSAWALIALGLYVVLAGVLAGSGRPIGRFLGAAAVAAALYAPWAGYAWPQLLGRAAGETSTNIGQQFGIAYFLELGLRDLTMAQSSGPAGPALIAAALAAGAVAAFVNARSGTPRARAVPIAVLPALTIVLTLLGVAFAARSWAFNARMLIGAVPALAMLLAWAFDAMLGRWRFAAGDGCGVPASNLRPIAAGVMGALLLAAYAPTVLDFVPRKTLEVFDPYNPRAYAANLAPRGRGPDVAFFNVLSPAGFFAMERTSSMPDWSYALTWDPVIEPRELWERRVSDAAADRERVWIVLYRGLAGRNGDLRGWMDSTYFPAYSTWGEEEVFYGLYGTGRHALADAAVDGARWGDLVLDGARVASRVGAGDVIPVALAWRAAAPIQANHKVFAHALDAQGNLIAQHDAAPLNDLRPTFTLPVGEIVRDNHGLALPAGYQGALRVMIGLYDPATGRRVRAEDGRDAIDLGLVVAGPEP